jgi:hypothetical protein
MYIESDIFDDLDRIRISLENPVPLGPRKLPRHEKQEWFLKGPVPWTWIEKAAGLPGKSLFVGLALWRLAGWQRKSTVTYSTKNPQVLSRNAARRGLWALEKAGLISVARAPGKASRVTILKR